jgi:hypothetical protein
MPLAPRHTFARAASQLLDRLADYCERVAAEIAAAFAPRTASPWHFGTWDTLDWLNLWQPGVVELADDLPQETLNNDLSPRLQAC